MAMANRARSDVFMLYADVSSVTLGARLVCSEEARRAGFLYISVAILLIRDSKGNGRPRRREEGHVNQEIRTSPRLH